MPMPLTLCFRLKLATTCPGRLAVGRTKCPGQFERARLNSLICLKFRYGDARAKKPMTLPRAKERHPLWRGSSNEKVSGSLGTGCGCSGLSQRLQAISRFEKDHHAQGHGGGAVQPTAELVGPAGNSQLGGLDPRRPAAGEWNRGTAASVEYPQSLEPDQREV